MMKDKKLPIIAVLLIISIANFSRIKGTEDIRTVVFLSIFVIGALSGILLIRLVAKLKNRS